MSWLPYCWVLGMGLQKLPSPHLLCHVLYLLRIGPLQRTGWTLDPGREWAANWLWLWDKGPGKWIQKRQILGKDRLRSIFRDPSQAKDSVGAESRVQEATSWSSAPGHRLEGSSAESMTLGKSYTLLSLNVPIQKIRDAILASWVHCRDEKLYI